MNKISWLRKRFIFIAGPCVIESRKLAFETAAFLKDLTAALPVTLVFKASFDKANRTSLGSFRGPGLVRGLKILEEIKNKLGVLLLSDVHCGSQIKEVKDLLDVIQIPAFLCRQTDLILAAAETGRVINLKKGQFLAPQDVRYLVQKVESTGNKNILLTERGTCFGYHDLVVDFRSFLVLKELGYPVLYDVTHSLQRPSAAEGVTGGDRAYAHPLALAATACGVDGLFLEVHPKPEAALSDQATSLPLCSLEKLLGQVLQLRQVLT